MKIKGELFKIPASLPTIVIMNFRPRRLIITSALAFAVMAEQIGSLSTAQNWQWMGKSFIKIVEETMAVLQRNFRGLGELKFRRSNIAMRTFDSATERRTYNFERRGETIDFMERLGKEGKRMKKTFEFMGIVVASLFLSLSLYYSFLRFLGTDTQIPSGTQYIFAPFSASCMPSQIIYFSDFLLFESSPFSGRSHAFEGKCKGRFLATDCIS